MGNVFKKNQGVVQAVPQQGGVYAPQAQQPLVQQQPQFVQQRPQFVQQQQPQFVQQQPPLVQQQPFVQQQPQYLPQQPPPQYRSSVPSFQQGAHRPLYPRGSPTPFSPTSNFSSSRGFDSSKFYENDALLANLTGWSTQDIERLRREFLNYANSSGVIDRESFRKVYVSSLLNMTWEALEHEVETAFRNFDIDHTGVLDFNEYITACSRLSREVNGFSPPPPYNR